MSWLGKVVGGAFGFLLGGPLGAILGASVGHQFDTGMEKMEGDESLLGSGNQHRVQMAFFTATFSIMGHLAKADGRVSEAEIHTAKRIMDQLGLSGAMRKTAINLFYKGKQADFPLLEVLEQFRKECHRRSQLIRMFIEIQLQAAYADGEIDSAEEMVLQAICAHLRISRFEYETIKIQFLAQQRFYSHGRQQYQEWTGRRRQDSLSDAYAVLGLKPSASDTDVKNAYRRLMSQHHPDKLVAKGLPEEMMTLAKEKTQKITKAYDTIRSSRNS